MPAENAPPNREAIRAGQLEQLRSLVAELIPANRFYARKLGAAGVTFDIASLEDYSARFPLTTKGELVRDQELSPPHGTNLTYPLDRYTRFHQTSGTTGAPLCWLDTPESWDWMVESWMTVFRAANVGPGDRVLFAFSFGPFIGFWLAFEAASRLGACCVPSGGLSSESRLNLLVTHGVTVLCCTPTYALRLAEVAAGAGINLTRSKVKTLLVAGEPGGSIPATRQRLESLWPGARVFDHHGMTEVGPVTYECPAHPGLLHILEAAYYAEVVDPETGRPVGEGQTGELVLTPLGRAGSPLLRYRTGDLVLAKSSEAPCRCGTHEMSIEGGILGRTDDMVIVRGVNLYPGAVENIIRAFGEVAEYRVTVDVAEAMAEMRLQVEPVEGAADVDNLAAKLEKALHNAFTLRVPVTIVAPGTLPRYELKARRWVKI